MRGITGRHKRYVHVVVDVDEDGVVTPLRIMWDEAHAYQIDAVLDVRRARSRMVEGGEVRYTIRVRGEPTYLFREGDRWFVAEKEAAL